MAGNQAGMEDTMRYLMMAAAAAAIMAAATHKGHAATALEKAQQAAAIAACKVEWIREGNKAADVRSATGYAFMSNCLNRSK